jgi:hypothetical protein
MEASWIYNRRKSKYWDGLTFFPFTASNKSHAKNKWMNGTYTSQDSYNIL